MIVMTLRQDDNTSITYSEEFMFEFTKWASIKYIRLSKGWAPHKAFTKLVGSANFYTTKELLEQFKKLKEENVQE